MAHAVRKLAGKQVPVVTLETLTTQIANRKTSSTYLHAQLPPLLARMAVALGEEAPASLASMPSLASLIQWYGDSALRIAELPPPPEWGAWRENPSKTFLAREAAFDDTLETIRSEGKLVRDRLFEAIEARSLPTLEAFDIQALVNVVWAFATAQQPAPEVPPSLAELPARSWQCSLVKCPRVCPRCAGHACAH